MVIYLASDFEENINKRWSKMYPLVSVIIPSYNHANFIQRCLKSLIAQTYENIELIIIDDGSRDNSTVKIMEMEMDLKSRFKKFTFISQENQGVCFTFNRGLDLVNGEYYQFLSSDDAMFEQYIEKQVDFLEQNSEFICSYSDGFEIQTEDLEKNMYNNALRFSDKLLFTSGDLRRFMLKNVFKMPSPAFMYRKETIEKIGYYDENLDFEDIDMFLRISREFKIGCLNEDLYIHRMHGYNTGKNIDILEAGIKKMIKKYSEEDNEYDLTEKKILLENFNTHYNEYYNYIKKRDFLCTAASSSVIKNRKLIVWGIGSFAEKVLAKDIIFEIDFFIDSSGKKEKFEGYDVFLPQKLINNPHSYFVFIASSFKKEISEILESYGYEYMKDYY